MTSGMYPNTRLRRNRNSASVRALVAENHLTPSDLLQPVFVLDQDTGTQAIEHLEGNQRMGIQPLIDYVGKLQDLGILGIFLFSTIKAEDRDAQGSYALREDGIIPRAARILREHFPEMMLIADVALDCYTDHGQDGLVDSQGRIMNDETIDVLCQQAHILAEAGCDSVSPSDMMDGRIGAIREYLDAQEHEDVRIISYACKYASCFYGPFRDAVGSAGRLKGDKRTYQMSFENAEEALHEARMDIEEGADMLIVKPGIAYLDILHRVKATFQKPTLSYQVSGEYGMMQAAAKAGVLDWDQAIMESMIAFKRAGADAIITYAAREIAEKLRR